MADLERHAGVLPRFSSNSAKLALADAAFELVDRGQFSLVLELADRVEEALPDLTSVSWWRGQARDGLGQHDVAIAEYTRTIEETPEFHYARLKRGTVLLVEGRAAEALPDLDAYVEAEPEHSYGWYAHAGAMHGLQRYEDGLASIERALALDDESAEFHYWRAILLIGAGRQADGRASLAAAIDRAPDEAKYTELARQLDAHD